MKKLFITLATFATISTNAFAVSWSVVSCWNGYSNADQQKNLTACKKEVRDNQKCSTNLWEHKHAAYDVCLMESSDPTKVITLFKGYSQKDQDANLAQCKSQETSSRVCITNAWTHGHGAYDVCLME